MYLGHHRDKGFLERNKLCHEYQEGVGNKRPITIQIFYFSMGEMGPGTAASSCETDVIGLGLGLG